MSAERLALVRDYCSPLRTMDAVMGESRSRWLWAMKQRLNLYPSEPPES